MLSISTNKLQNKYSVGQRFKNSPEDKEPYFKLIKITESLGGLKYYRVRCLYNDLELILHEEDLYPMD